MSSISQLELRQQIVAQAQQMNASGLNHGTAGNLSARWQDIMLITPTGCVYDRLSPDMLAAMSLDDDQGTWTGPCKPSSEWRFHRDIFRDRPEAGAIVHTHSPYATALAMTRRDLPACHYMIALFGGDNVRCAPYARYGTAELSQLAVAALKARKACLLANHGMITIGPDLDKAMALAVELEALAKMYCLSLQMGGPHLLSQRQMQEALQSFASYGQQNG